MLITNRRDSVLPADWPEVLNSILATLSQALTETADRERALDEGLASQNAAAGGEAVGAGMLERLDQSLRPFESSYQEAERKASEMDTELQASHDSMQRWLGAVTAFRQRLGNSPLACIR